MTARDASAAKRDIFDHLIGAGDMDIRRSAMLHVAPPPLPHDFDFGRVEGMMLTLAVGDSLGNTTEGMFPAERRRRYGEITDYLPNPYGGIRGVPSDDTPSRLASVWSEVGWQRSAHAHRPGPDPAREGGHP